MTSQSFGSGVLKSPVPSTEDDGVNNQDRFSVALPADIDSNRVIASRSSTRAIASVSGSNTPGDQMLHRRGRSNTLDSDHLHSRADETSSNKHLKDSDQSKQAHQFRASYSKSKTQSEYPLRRTTSRSLSHVNDTDTAPKDEDVQKHHKSPVDTTTNLSKQRKKLPSSLAGPSNIDLEKRTTRSIDTSSSFRRQSSKSKLVHSPSLNGRTYPPREQSERMLYSSRLESNGIRSEAIQYPTTPNTSNDDVFFNDYGKQNRTPSSSNDSRGSALTDCSPENLSEERKRKISSSQETLQQSTSSSSGSRDSSRVDGSPKLLDNEKRMKEALSQAAEHQTTPSTSSNSRSSSMSDECPKDFKETKTDTPSQAGLRQSNQKISSSRSTSRMEEIYFDPSDFKAKELTVNRIPSNPTDRELTKKNDVPRTLANSKSPSKDGDARLKREKSRGRIRHSEGSAVQLDALLQQSNKLNGSSNVTEEKHQIAGARIRKNFVDSLAQDNVGLASRNSDVKGNTSSSGEMERLRTDLKIESGKNPHVDTKSFRREGSVRLHRKLDEGAKTLQNDKAVAKSQPTVSEERHPHVMPQMERSRSKKMVMKDTGSSLQCEVLQTDQPMKRSPSAKNVKANSVYQDNNHVPSTAVRKQATTISVSTSAKSPPTKQSSVRSSNSGGQKRKGESQCRLTVKPTTEGGHSSSSGGSANDARLNEADRNHTDALTVASDPSLPNNNEDFIKLQAAAASRKSLQFNNTHSKDATKSDQYSKTHQRKDSSSKIAATSTSGTRKVSISDGRSSSRTLEENRSSHRRSAKTNEQSSNNGAIGCNSRTEQVQTSVKPKAKRGVKNLNSIGSVGRNTSGGAAHSHGKPKDSTSLSSYLSDISVSTGADVTVASVQDSRNKEIGQNVANEKLKTSHLRRLVEPTQRREHIMRNSSHSSLALSSLGLRSSSSDQTETVADDRSISAEALFQASSKTPQQRGSRYPQRNSSRPKLFDSLNGPLKGDSAPITPLRRLSMTGQYERQYSIASSSRCSVSYSGEESEVEGGDLSYSERIEEENEDGEVSASSISHTNSTVTTTKPLDFDDLFSLFTWSISEQDPNQIQRARRRLRDNIIGTPLFRAMESNREWMPPTSQ